MAANAPLFRNVAKGSVAVVQEELIRLPLVELRMAVVSCPTKSAQRLGGVRPLHVIDDEKIEQAVVVHVDPGSRNCPVSSKLRIGTVQARVQSRFYGHVTKRTVAVVVVERAVVQAGNKEIGVAVIIVVCYGDAHVVARASQASRVGHVGEDAVTVVAKQAIAVFGRVFFQRGDVGAVGEEDVGTAVAVVVENGHSAGHGLRRILGRCLIVLQAEGDSAEFEPDRAGGGGTLEQNNYSQTHHRSRNDSPNQPVNKHSRPE